MNYAQDQLVGLPYQDEDLFESARYRAFYWDSIEPRGLVAVVPEVVVALADEADEYLAHNVVADFENTGYFDC